MNQQTIQGNWHQLRGQIKERWSEFSGDDLDHFEGGLEQLVGMIEVRTGEARDAIEEQLAKFAEQTEEGASLSDTAMDKASEYAHAAAEAVQHTTERAADTIREKYHEAEEVVKKNPLESLALTFVAGLVLGASATLILRSK